MPEAWLSLGSNIGDKRANLAAALAALERSGVTVIARSGDYRTPPWGPIAQDWFVNACAAVRTALPPRDCFASAWLWSATWVGSGRSAGARG